MAGAVFQPEPTVHGYPTRVGLTDLWRRTLRRVARSTEHRAVGDVERRAAGCERHDVINGQVAGRMGVALVARAPVPMLATPGAQQPSAEALPLPRAVQRVVAAAVRLPRMLGAPTAGSARDDAADGAELHDQRRLSVRRRADTVAARLTLVTLDCTPFDIETSVSEAVATVYSPAVLRLRDQSWASGEGADLARLRPSAWLRRRISRILRMAERGRDTGICSSNGWIVRGAVPGPVYLTSAALAACPAR